MNPENFLSAIIDIAEEGTVLVVGTGEEPSIGSILQRLTSLPVGYAGAVIANPSSGTDASVIDDIAGGLETLGGPFAVIFCEAGLSAQALDHWFGALRRLGTENAMLVGANLPEEGAGALLFTLAGRHRLNLQAGDSFWFATARPLAVSLKFDSNIGGFMRPIHQISMAETLGATEDRELFLTASRAGIACRFKGGAGAPFVSPLPRNYASVEDLLSQVPIMGGYHDHVEADGPALSFLTDVTMCGRLGLLYSAAGGLYDESYSSGEILRPVYRQIVWEHDNFLLEGSCQLGNSTMPQLGGMVPAVRHRIDQPVVMINSWDLWCYNHWVIYALSRFWYRDAFPELRDLPIVIGPINRQFQVDYLDMLGLGDATFFQYQQTAGLSLARAYHPTQVDPPPYSPGCIAWLRDRFLPHAAAVPADYRSGRYYITRRNAESRRTLNEDAMIELLERFGFQTLDFAEFSVREQIALMRHAEAVVGHHGSSMTNIIYCSPGCKVIDLTPTTESMRMSKIGAIEPAITFAPAALGVHYAVMPANDADVPGKPHANFGYDLKRLQDLLEQMLG